MKDTIVQTTEHKSELHGFHGGGRARLPWRLLLQDKIQRENKEDTCACSPRMQWAQREGQGSLDSGVIRLQLTATGDGDEEHGVSLGASWLAILCMVV